MTEPRPEFLQCRRRLVLLVACMALACFALLGFAIRWQVVDTEYLQS